MLQLVCMLAALTASGNALTSEWTYFDVQSWGNVSAICTTGHHQSPIAIDTTNVEFDGKLSQDQLHFAGYVGIRRGVLINNGHTIVFANEASDLVPGHHRANATWSINGTNQNNVPDDVYQTDGVDTDQIVQHPKIYGGQLPSNSDFHLAQVHFHWGDTPSQGAEHVIDNEPSPLEAHFVHYNDKYNSLAEAIPNEDGVAVVGFLFQLKSPDAEDDGKVDYKQFIRYFPKVPAEHDEIPAVIDFGKLIPKWARDGSGTFYRYNGSLTTPPCSETVTWTVYEDRIPVDAGLLAGLIKLLTNRFDPQKNATYKLPLVNNFRPLQQLSNRTIFTNQPAENRRIKAYLSSSSSFACCNLRTLFVLVLHLLWFSH